MTPLVLEKAVARKLAGFNEDYDTCLHSGEKQMKFADLVANLRLLFRAREYVAVKQKFNELLQLYEHDVCATQYISTAYKRAQNRVVRLRNGHELIHREYALYVNCNFIPFQPKSTLLYVKEKSHWICL